MKFSPEEMAIDASDASMGLVVGRGMDSWRRFVKFKSSYARIEPDLRKFFRNDKSVNNVLRQAMQMMKPLNRKTSAGKRRDSIRAGTVSPAERSRWQKILTFDRGFVALQPRLRKFFRDDTAVNEALRKSMELMMLSPVTGKKTA